MFFNSFLLPRVNAQLERLMGTNVVRLTDRQYMTDLRRRIYEDFNEMLAKRIKKREVSYFLCLLKKNYKYIVGDYNL